LLILAIVTISVLFGEVLEIDDSNISGRNEFARKTTLYDIPVDCQYNSFYFASSSKNAKLYIYEIKLIR